MDFVNYPEFILEDNRTERSYNPISIEQVTKKHRALFSKTNLTGKTILDIGSCLGATGHWTLVCGAKQYTGIEPQKEYADKSRKLLEQYHPKTKFLIFQNGVRDWFNKNSLQYDIVVLSGVLYVFSDYYSILKESTDRAREQIIFENLYPKMQNYKGFKGVQFINQQPINSSIRNQSIVGRGTRIGPEGMGWIMKDFGFGNGEVLTPEKIIGSFDIYDESLNLLPNFSSRYIIKFERTGQVEKDLSETLLSRDFSHTYEW